MNGWKRASSPWKRQVCVPVSELPPLHQQGDWSLKTVVMVVQVRHLWNKITHEVQFYLTSLDSDALILGRAIRLHWVLRMVYIGHWTSQWRCLPCSYRTCTKTCIAATGALNGLNREQSLKRSNHKNRIELQWIIITCLLFLLLVYPNMMMHLYPCQ